MTGGPIARHVGDARAGSVETAAFVGATTCAGCHASEAERWSRSHHALAMQEATDATVLGDFGDARLEHFGVVTTFSRSADRFLVRTDGPDGTMQDYEIAYTFGVHPLQQYLIAFPDGRYQALGVAWDSRPRDEGGQRWFHLYPDEKLTGGDRLHWTGRDQTWNYMCADCHSTGLKKGYDLDTNSYATTWTDVNVACEACHGPGSRHVAWAREAAAVSSGAARAYPRSLSGLTGNGLIASLKATDRGRWEMDPAAGTSRRTEPLVSAELDACAGCHALRKALAEERLPGAPFLDGHLPALLEPGLYHADGQIDDEVFEYGSFLQSRMHHAGVTCSDCHEPHALELRAEGNTLCGQCHLPARFDTAGHHRHAPDSAGAQCVSCHMPAKTYMGVDDRRDHGFRVPRPDLSRSIGTPNACTQCHADRSDAWAAETVAAWYPNGRHTTPHFGVALHAGRIGARDAEPQLARLILDGTQPAIARATALLLLRSHASSASEGALRAAVADPDPLVRSAAPRASSVAAPRSAIQLVVPLLSDPVRAVRIEAARALAAVDPQATTAEQRAALDAAHAELVAAEHVDADRPEAHLNLGLLAVRRRRPDEAEAAYRTALRLAPTFVPALVNLADLERMRGRDTEGAEFLRKAMAIEPDNADVRHSLGLLLVRQRDYAGALDLLREASDLAPDNARYAYVHAIALNSTGASGQAIAVLERTHAKHPADADVLAALVTIARDRGDIAMALLHAKTLRALYPADTQLETLVRALEEQQER